MRSDGRTLKINIMAEFKAALPYTLQYEGGWNHVTGDDETYQGINRRMFPNWAGWVYIDTAKPLKYNEILDSPDVRAFVTQFYKENFWDKMLGDGIDSQAVATYLYDFKVNAGGNAIKCVQRILGVADDGIFGNGSLNALNAYSGDLLSLLHTARVEYYTKLNNPKFLAGWLSRANSLYSILAG